MLTDSKSVVDVLLCESTVWLGGGVRLTGFEDARLVSSPAIHSLGDLTGLSRGGGTRVRELMSDNVVVWTEEFASSFTSTRGRTFSTGESIKEVLTCRRMLCISCWSVKFCSSKPRLWFASSSESLPDASAPLRILNVTLSFSAVLPRDIILAMLTLFKLPIEASRTGI